MSHSYCFNTKVLRVTDSIQTEKYVQKDTSTITTTLLCVRDSGFSWIMMAFLAGHSLLYGNIQSTDITPGEIWHCFSLHNAPPTTIIIISTRKEKHVFIFLLVVDFYYKDISFLESTVFIHLFTNAP